VDLSYPLHLISLLPPLLKEGWGGFILSLFKGTSRPSFLKTNLTGLNLDVSDDSQESKTMDEFYQWLRGDF